MDGEQHPFGRIKKYFARLRSSGVGVNLEDEESKTGLRSQDVPALQQFLNIISNGNERNNSRYSSWFNSYLEKCWSKLTPQLRTIVLGGSDHLGLPPRPVLYGLLCVIAEYLTTTNQPTLSEISNQLVDQKYLVDDESQEVNRHELVFIIVGWLTMLYSPDSSHEAGTITISPVINTDGIPLSNTTFSNTSINLGDVALLPIHQVLKYFGELIPGSKDLNHPLAPSATRLPDYFPEQLLASYLNFATLSKVADIRIEFVDMLSLHLEFDERTRKLQIFRFPSACRLMCLPGSKGEANNYLNSLFDYSLNSQPEDEYGQTWDHTGNNNHQAYALFREALLSYRLLFGQNNKARTRVPQRPHEGDINDPLLKDLCSGNHHSLAVYEEISAPPSRDQYSATKEFPYFGKRLLSLQEFVIRQAPSDLKKLWYDRRDTLRFWTFWAVFAFGGISIVLSMAQLVVGILQVRAS